MHTVPVVANDDGDALFRLSTLLETQIPGERVQVWEAPSLPLALGLWILVEGLRHREQSAVLIKQ